MPQFSIKTSDISNNLINITDKSMLKHIFSVLRLQQNSELLLIDENEIAYTTRILECNKDKIITKIEHAQKSNKKLNFTLDIFQCTLKSTAMDLVIQKMTELGVKNIYSAPSHRSVSKFTPKEATGKIKKWQKIAMESCKQCERADKPNIYYLENIKKLSELANNYDLIIACVERSNDKTLKDVLRNAKKHDKVLVIIGPEGGFEDNEIDFLKNNKFECVSISNLIFRAETAAINAISGVIYEYEL